MKCSDFLAGFSEFYDEDPSLENAQAFRDHVERCSSCHRYWTVVSRGTELLRSLPAPGPREDLRERIRHSIYTLEEERRRGRDSFGASGVVVVIATAAVLAALVWTPGFTGTDPSVDLSPIRVQAPPVAGPLGFPAGRVGLPAGAPFLESDLWTGSNALLYEHSSLGQRSRGAGVVRTGLQ